MHPSSVWHRPVGSKNFQPFGVVPNKKTIGAADLKSGGNDDDENSDSCSSSSSEDADYAAIYDVAGTSKMMQKKKKKKMKKSSWFVLMEKPPLTKYVDGTTDANERVALFDRRRALQEEMQGLQRRLSVKMSERAVAEEKMMEASDRICNQAPEEEDEEELLKSVIAASEKCDVIGRECGSITSRLNLLQEQMEELDITLHGEAVDYKSSPVFKAMQDFKKAQISSRNEPIFRKKDVVELKIFQKKYRMWETPKIETHECMNLPLPSYIEDELLSSPATGLSAYCEAVLTAMSRDDSLSVYQLITHPNAPKIMRFADERFDHIGFMKILFTDNTHTRKASETTKMSMFLALSQRYRKFSLSKPGDAGAAQVSPVSCRKPPLELSSRKLDVIAQSDEKFEIAPNVLKYKFEGRPNMCLTRSGIEKSTRSSLVSYSHGNHEFSDVRDDILCVMPSINIDETVLKWHIEGCVRIQFRGGLFIDFAHVSREAFFIDDRNDDGLDKSRALVEIFLVCSKRANMVVDWLGGPASFRHYGNACLKDEVCDAMLGKQVDPYKKPGVCCVWHGSVTGYKFVSSKKK